jgi:hypothetical protein
MPISGGSASSVRSGLVDARTYRRIITASIGALLIVVVGAAILTPDGDAPDLPEPIQALFPLPGDTVVRQTAIEVDLPVGYDLELFVDGIRIPAAEIGFTEATGERIWQPGPFSLFAAWTPGDHSVEIAWERIGGGTVDRGEYRWTFRVV